MKKKSSFFVSIGILIVFFLAGCSGGANEANGKGGDKVVIRIGHDSSTNHPSHTALEEFEKTVEQRSENKIDVQLFPAGQLGDASEIMEQVRRGDVEMGLGASTHFTKTFPELAVWESFYLFDDAAHAHRVLDGKAGQETLDALNSNGLTGLGYMEIGFRNFSNDKKPLETIEDFNGLKIRGYNPLQIKAWESLGVSLTNLAWGELFTSLQQNLIDGQESATTSFYDEKFYEAQEYWTLTKHVYTNYLWYTNSKFMDGLSGENKEIIQEEIKNAITLERELMAQLEEETLEKLPEEGVKVNDLPLEERHKMGESMNNAIKDDIIKQTGQELYDLVKAEVDKER
ncbi:TRAP transporter substrate-binding protein [Fredinandcohnia onubensis]|uniref:TRAP transporter substrate-binding protein n=1 Tax=Fredinandcohnia onubensis TaxID=1571209 RepID=UPI000C0BC135|nr:TRAP transporter substrate-binding protein [Fredinandcohnia onubensis]